jgi:transcriptional regulator with XRE-family HTH domain
MVSNLKALRKAKGMTQNSLAEATKLHRITIAKYEAGMVSPTLDSAQKLAKALGVSIEDLMKKAG